MAPRSKKSGKKKPLSLEEQQKIEYIRMQADPCYVVRDLFGSALWRDQETILECVRDYPKTAWRSCHGIGKTFIVARLVLWWLYSFPKSIVITTAPTWRQVQDLVWKEIRSCHAHSIMPLGGNLAPSATQLSLDGKEWVALGLSTNDSNRFQGYHAEHLLVVVDEAAGVAEDIFEAIAGVLTSAHCRLVLIGNPTDIGGQFYRAFRTPEVWHTGKTAAWDTPNFTEYGITREDIIKGTWKAKAPRNKDGGYEWLYPWLITPQWAAEQLADWGEHHPAWFARVEGDFPEQGEYNVIPLSWIELAQDRWLDTEVTGQPVLGVDVARGGMDKSAIAVRVDNKILRIETFSGLDTQELAAEVIRIYREVDAQMANVEANGMGVGVIDELRKHKDIITNEVNVSTKSELLDPKGNRLYANLRAELWWTLRNALDPKGDTLLAIPPTAKGLVADLAAPKYDMRSGPIKIELKEETKARLKRSPDEADAVMISFAPVQRKQGPRLVVPLPAAEDMVVPGYRIGPYGSSGGGVGFTGLPNVPGINP